MNCCEMKDIAYINTHTHLGNPDILSPAVGQIYCVFPPKVDTFVIACFRLVKMVIVCMILMFMFVI